MTFKRHPNRERARIERRLEDLAPTLDQAGLDELLAMLPDAAGRASVLAYVRPLLTFTPKDLTNG